MTYRPKNEFKISSDHKVVYNEHAEHRIVNDVTIEIKTWPSMPDEHRVEIAQTIQAAMNRAFCTGKTIPVEHVNLRIDTGAALHNFSAVMVLLIGAAVFASNISNSFAAYATLGIIAGSFVTVTAALIALLLIKRNHEKRTHPKSTH